MNINIIAAIGKNNELGKNNDLIWKFKEDMKIFKGTTMGYPVVMGRRTFESLPNILPGRENIVISTQEINNDKIKLYKSIKEFLISYKNYNSDVFIIGGASIYKAFIDIATALYLTEIDAIENDADVYFPIFNKEEFNKEIIKELEENGIKYRHVLYKRK
jgi:dihydrofolate reductase